MTRSLDDVFPIDPEDEVSDRDLLSILGIATGNSVGDHDDIPQP